MLYSILTEVAFQRTKLITVQYINAITMSPLLLQQVNKELFIVNSQLKYSPKT